MRYGFRTSTQWTTDGASLSDIVAAEPRLKAVLDAQRIGAHKPEVPVRLATGVHDDIVPHAQARRLAAGWCAKGACASSAPRISAWGSAPFPS